MSAKVIAEALAAAEDAVPQSIGRRHDQYVIVDEDSVIDDSGWGLTMMAQEQRVSTRKPRVVYVRHDAMLAALSHLAAKLERTEKHAAELGAKLERAPMTVAAYEAEALRTYENPIIGDDAQELLALLTLGLVGEAGEVADLVKKHLGHGHALDPAKVREELGDVIWYVPALCRLLGFSLEDVLAHNVEKLRRRYPNGFSREASLARADVSDALDKGAQDG